MTISSGQAAAGVEADSKFRELWSTDGEMNHRNQFVDPWRCSRRDGSAFGAPVRSNRVAGSMATSGARAEEGSMAECRGLWCSAGGDKAEEAGRFCGCGDVSRGSNMALQSAGEEAAVRAFLELLLVLVKEERIRESSRRACKTGAGLGCCLDDGLAAGPSVRRERKE